MPQMNVAHLVNGIPTMLAGLSVILMAIGVVPMAKVPEDSEAKRKKFLPFLWVGGTGCLGWGVIRCLGVCGGA